MGISMQFSRKKEKRTKMSEPCFVGDVCKQPKQSKSRSEIFTEKKEARALGMAINRPLCGLVFLKWNGNESTMKSFT